MVTLGSREDLGRKLLRLKEQLEEQKGERAEKQGELKSVMKQLKMDFNIDSIDQAGVLIKTEEESLQDMENSISTQITEIEELMEEGNDDQY